MVCLVEHVEAEVWRGVGVDYCEALLGSRIKAEPRAMCGIACPKRLYEAGRSVLVLVGKRSGGVGRPRFGQRIRRRDGEAWSSGVKLNETADPLVRFVVLQTAMNGVGGLGAGTWWQRETDETRERSIGWIQNQLAAAQVVRNIDDPPFDAEGGKGHCYWNIGGMDADNCRRTLVGLAAAHQADVLYR